MMGMPASMMCVVVIDVPVGIGALEFGGCIGARGGGGVVVGGFFLWRARIERCRGEWFRGVGWRTGGVWYKGRARLARLGAVGGSE